jgi:hypothetical protein
VDNLINILISSDIKLQKTVFLYHPVLGFVAAPGETRLLARGWNGVPNFDTTPLAIIELSKARFYRFWWGRRTPFENLREHMHRWVWNRIWVYCEHAMARTQTVYCTQGLLLLYMKCLRPIWVKFGCCQSSFFRKGLFRAFLYLLQPHLPCMIRPVVDPKPCVKIWARQWFRESKYELSPKKKSATHRKTSMKTDGKWNSGG